MSYSTYRFSGTKRVYYRDELAMWIVKETSNNGQYHWWDVFARLYSREKKRHINLHGRVGAPYLTGDKFYDIQVEGLTEKAEINVNITTRNEAFDEIARLTRIEAGDNPQLT